MMGTSGPWNKNHVFIPSLQIWDFPYNFSSSVVFQIYPLLLVIFNINFFSLFSSFHNSSMLFSEVVPTYKLVVKTSGPEEEHVKGIKPT